MNGTFNLRVLSAMRLFVKAACILLVLGGLGVLAGWTFDIEFLKSLGPQFNSMKVNTAIAFILSGCSLWLLEDERVDLRRRRVGNGIAVLVLLIGALTLGEYIFGWELGIDELFVADLGPGPYPGRMSAVGAFGLVLIGLALFWIERPISQYLSLIVLLLAMIAAIGYILDFGELYRLTGYSNVALLATGLCVILALALAAARPTRGFIKMLVLDMPGSRMLRFLLPITLIVTVILGGLVEAGERQGLFSSANAGVVLIVLLILTYSLLFFFHAREINRVEQKLYERETQTGALIESALDGVITIDNHSRILAWNPQVEIIFGWPAAQALGRYVYDLIIPQDHREAHKKGMEHFLVTGEGPVLNKRIEISGLHRNGHEFPIELAITPHKVGETFHFNAFVRDITVQKRAANELKKNELVLRLFVKHTPASVAMFDREMCYIVASDRYLQDYGLAQQDLTGRSHYDIFPEISDHWKEIHRRCLAGVIEKAEEDPFPRKDGTTDWVRWEIHPWYQLDGNIGGIILFSEVITERKQAQETIRAAEERYRRTMEEMIEGGQIIGHDWRYLYLNAEATRQGGKPREELIGRTMMEAYPGIENTFLFTVLQRCMTDRQPSHMENEFIYPDGSKGWFQLSIQPVPEGLFILSMNITERKLAEIKSAQLSRMYATLSQVNETIVRAKDPQELYQKICDVTVEYGKFSLVWAGLLDETSGEIRPVAANGLDVHNWPFEQVNIHSGMFKDGLMATAVRTGKVVTSDDVGTDKRTEGAHEQLKSLEYHSTAAVPFHCRGRVIGAVCLVSSEFGFFKAEEEIQLLEEMGGDITFALDGMEAGAERKRAEESFRLAIESAPNAVLIVDKTGSITLLNSQTEMYFGYQRNELIGENIEQLVPERYRRNHPGHRDEFLAAPQARSMGVGRDLYGLRKDGSEFPVEIGLSPLETETGLLVLVTIVDITKRKEDEQSIRASERRYRSLFEDSPICIWDEDFSLVKARIDELRNQGVTDFRAYFAAHPDEVRACASLVKIIDVNRAALEIYEAASREDMLGPLAEITHPEALTSFLDEILHVVDGHTSFQWERTDFTLKGRPIEVNLSWSVAAGHENDYSKVIVSAVDITERRRAELETHRQLERLKALRTIDIAISSSFDLKLTLDVVLSQVLALLNVDAAAVLLLHPGIKTLEYAASRGFRSLDIRNARINLKGGYAARAIRERHTVHVPELLELTGEAASPSLFKEEGFVEYYCAPLLVKGEIKGALEILNRSSIHEDQQWLDFLETLAGQTAIAIENSQLFNGLQRSNIELSLAYDATIEGWSQALDLRDKETEGHSKRVTDMTLQLAQAMSIDEREIIHIRRGALLHDIGKLGVPDNILLKPGKLTDEEWVIMRRHPENAYNMLRSVSYLRPALDIPYCHHEKWDGSGYPRGLKGEEIPLAARMFAIVDVWDALHSDRPYRAGWPNEKIREYILEQSGIHFDPKVVEVFIQLPGTENP